MTIIECNDMKRRTVRIVVHRMSGAILTVTRQNARDTRTEIEVALSEEHCLELAKVLQKSA